MRRCLSYLLIPARAAGLLRSTLRFYWRLAWRAAAEVFAPEAPPWNPQRWEFRNALLRQAGLRIGRGSIVGPGLKSLVSLHDRVQIGENCFLGPMVHLWAFHRLEIGACTVLGPECSLANGSHDPSTLEPLAQPLVVGRGCRIGHGVHIVRGVRIGDLAVVEPGSVVTADVAEAAIVGGVPARFVAQREIAESEHLWGDRWFCPRTFQIVSPLNSGEAIRHTAS